MLTAVYAGTPDFSAEILEKLCSDLQDHVKVIAVLTQPDRPVGRKKILTPSPVKLLAETKNIPVFHTEDELLAYIDEQKKEKSVSVDLAIIYAYGAIIKPNFLNAFPQACWNIHPSLLPLYRGPAPHIFPLLLGDEMTGVSLMIIDEEMDHGPLIDQINVQIEENDTQESLIKRLTEVGYELLKKNLILYDEAKEKIVPEPQSHELATYTKLLKRDDGYVSPELLKQNASTDENIPKIFKWFYEKNNIQPKNIETNKLLYAMYRALHPWPGIWTTIKNQDGSLQRLKLTKLALENDQLIIEKAQLEGGKETDFKQLKALIQH